MVTIGALWLPILLSAVAVWVASAVIWMVMPHHKSDFRKLPDEDAALRALTPQRLVPGQYSIPYGTATVPEAIWFGRPWSVVVKGLLDALVYGLLTAGFFGWLWPA